MLFKQRILEFRAKYDFTQSQLADLFGVTQTTVFKYEAGINKPTSAHLIKFEKKMKEWEENKNENV